MAGPPHSHPDSGIVWLYAHYVKMFADAKRSLIFGHETVQK